MAELPSVCPYLVVPDVDAMVSFLESVFGAKETFERHTRPDGSVAHTQLTVGNSVIMMGGASKQFGAVPCLIHLYVDDVDKRYDAALAAGATSVEEPRDSEDDPDRRGGVEFHGVQFWVGAPQRP